MICLSVCLFVLFCFLPSESWSPFTSIVWEMSATSFPVKLQQSLWTEKLLLTVHTDNDWILTSLWTIPLTSQCPYKQLCTFTNVSAYTCTCRNGYFWKKVVKDAHKKYLNLKHIYNFHVKMFKNHHILVVFLFCVCVCVCVCAYIMPNVYSSIQTVRNLM